MIEIFVGRQPIYNPQLKVVGYELLFRSYDKGTSDVIDGDRATSQVILNTFMEIGLERLVEDGLAFINLTRNFLTERHPLPLPQERVVLEILENITVDDELVEAVRGLAGRGYQIALDDVVSPHGLERLLDIVHLVKVDLMGMDREHLEAHTALYKRYRLKLLAEKIETQEEFERCRQLGFDYFQGYFLSKPVVVKGQQIAPSRLAVLRLLARLQAPGVEFSDLEEIIRQDVSLSYKLLRLINSAAYAKPRAIQSIRQALTYLGIRQVQSWISLLLLSQIDGKPSELLRTAIVRARMGELLAMAIREPNAGPYFTAGLFSALDALLDQPLEEVLASLPLSDELEAALLRYEGQIGNVLNCVLAYEQGDWHTVALPGLDPGQIRDRYLEAIAWASTVLATLG
jgi:EAL and modified HD-GYP domain-containing signal transduction protein